MKVTGTITAVLPETGGVSKSGKQWRKQEAIVEYEHGQYPKSIVFSTMNDHIEKLNLRQGVDYELEIDFTTREYQGKHFLQASCWKATSLNNVAPSPAPAQQGWQAAYPQPQQAQSTPPPTQGEDLPF